MRHHISITTPSQQHLLLDVRSLPDALISEVLSNVVFYDVPFQHLPILLRENTRRQFRLSLETRATQNPTSSSSTPSTTPQNTTSSNSTSSTSSSTSSRIPDPIPSSAERLDESFYRLLLQKVPPTEIDFVTRFCAEHTLNLRRRIPRMSKEQKSRRLSVLTQLASQTNPSILLATTNDRVFSILQTDPTLRHKWFRHAFTEGELLMLPDHINQLCDWLKGK